jgi:Arc/MetJ-type ribon-helix-helix transcriptional regulator
MLTTINISLPKEMIEDAKKFVKKKQYASVSELIRDTLRKKLYPDLTENGFTREFEDAVLRSEKSPTKNDVVLKTNKDIDKFFRDLHN